MFVFLFIAACMSVTKLLSRQSAGTFSLHSRQPTLQQDMNDVCVVVHCCIFECCRIINAISRFFIISLLSFTCFHVNPLYSRTWMMFVLLFITAYMSVVESSLPQQSASTLSSIYILLCFHVNPFYSSAEWCLCCCSLLHIWVWWNHHSNQ